MLNVFLTIDTEIWDSKIKWTNAAIAKAIERDIYGIVSGKEFGLRFQIERLNFYGLKANFFVEPLFTCVAGDEPLCEVISTIQKFGHDVQLHIHAEWLKYMDSLIVQPGIGYQMRDFTKAQQSFLIKYCIEKLVNCGAKAVKAFRAGDFGANFDTLRALSENNISYDTSYNFCYLETTCGLRLPEVLLQPKKISGVWEFPIGFFVDMSKHTRHLQLQSCSIREFKYVLEKAWELNWFSVVILFHTFELINRNMCTHKLPSVDRIVLKRFEDLCSFLGSNKDKFCTSLFSELSFKSIPSVDFLKPIKSKVSYTILRYCQQILRRFYS